MNILYVSALEGGKYTGPIYSVPKQIIGQSQYDNVYWVNLSDIKNADLFDKNFYHYIPYKQFRFSSLQAPFDCPDLIIFEEFFKIECCRVARLAEKLNIPYIIVPRCQMTENYLKNKRFKKKVASILLFNRFAKKALAVQFLSKQEKRDSEAYYSGKSFIAPNGIELKNKKADVNSKPVIGTFIGRYSIWQKGLDMLLEAVQNKKVRLEEKGILIRLYGPNDRTSFPNEVKKLVSEKALEGIVSVHGPVFDKEKEDVLLSSNFFIHTSRFEGMPMSVLDALSYGIPCLVTQGSNMREDIDIFNAGWGADNSVESIKQTLDTLCDTIDELREKGENARDLAAKYSWDSIAKDCHDVYSNFICK